MKKEEIVKLDVKKHIKIWLLHKLGMSRREIAEALGTNPGHVGNEIKKYQVDKQKQDEAERLLDPNMDGKTNSLKNNVGKVKKAVPTKIDVEYERQRLINAGMPDVAKDRYPVEKDVQSFGQRMKEARLKKAEERAKLSPKELEQEKLLKILESVNKMTGKELLSEFGIRDDQQMYGTAKRGDIFDKQYSSLSEGKGITIGLKTLMALKKLMPLKTKLTEQKLVNSSDADRYNGNGEDRESEYGVYRATELNLDVIYSKTDTKIGHITQNGIYSNTEIKPLQDAISKFKDYFKEGKTPADVSFSEIEAELNKAATEKAESEKWRNDKVSEDDKKKAKEELNKWYSESKKDIQQRLKEKGYNRNSKEFEEAISVLDNTYAAVNILIKKPIFKKFEIRYEWELPRERQYAYLTGQILADKWKIINQYEKEAQELKEKYRYGYDSTSFAAKKLAEDLNAFLGTTYTDNGYFHSGRWVGFGIYNSTKKFGEGGMAGDGAIVEGKKHGSGGVKTTTPNGPMEIEGGEIIINAKAAKEHCEELSKINQSAGNGVAFNCADPALDGIQGPMSGRGAKITADNITRADAYKLFDFHERTGFFPSEISSITEQEWEKIRKKFNLKRDPWDDGENDDGHKDQVGLGSQIQEGIEVEKEHKDLYNTLAERLKAEGVKMPMSQEEFFKMIAVAHIKERPDYYELLKNYVESDNIKKPYYLYTKDEVIATRDRIEMNTAAGIERCESCEQLLKDLQRYSYTKFKTLLKDLK